MARLSTVRIAGWKSIRDMDPGLELGALNVLIGANGSGKSNLVSFFKLLNELEAEHLQTLKELYVFCEGATEQEFCKQVLEPHLFPRHDGFIHPIAIKHSKHHGRVARGGVPGHYKTMRDDILNQLKGRKQRDVLFTTQIDLYGLPKDFPGKKARRRNPDDPIRSATSRPWNGRLRMTSATNDSSPTCNFTNTRPSSSPIPRCSYSPSTTAIGRSKSSRRSPPRSRPSSTSTTARRARLPSVSSVSYRLTRAGRRRSARGSPRTSACPRSARNAPFPHLAEPSGVAPPAVMRWGRSSRRLCRIGIGR